MKKIKYISLVVLVLILLSNIYAQILDSTSEKPIQYRRGVELQEGYSQRDRQTYEEKYAGKNLNEEKTRLFPLQSTGVWTELNPKVPRVDYLGINFINKDTGWAVGDLGALIKTTDGGSSWTVGETNTTTPILKVRSFNGQLVIASGFNGLILRSTDGGETFTQVTSGVTGDLWGLQMINDNLGWSCGTSNSLVKTTDGGLTWQRIFTPGYTSDYWWIDFLTEDYGFIAGDGKVLRTIDGGDNWEIIQAGDNQALYSIDVIDSLHIAAAGFGGTSYPAKNIYSSNGGNTWINGGTLTTSEINCIKYVSLDTGYAVMSNIGLWKTTNRGQNWAIAAGIGEYELQYFAEGRIGYNAGTVLKLWKAEGSYDVWQRMIINDNFADVFFTSEITGYIAGGTWIGGPVYETTNGGVSWFGIPNFPINLFTTSLASLIFTDSLKGFAGGAPCRIVKTTDAGLTWNSANRTGLADTIGQIRKFFFINPSTGWSVTSRGGILKTIDGGDNWFAQLNAPLSIGFSSINLVDSLYGWTANSDRPFKTIDGGVNWIQQIDINIGQSRDVFFIDYQNGFLLESNKLYKTTDGGFTWIQYQNLTGFSIAKLSIYRDSTIFIIGYKTYRSINGGENWFEFTELNGIRITGLSLLNSGSGFAVGELGLIIKYYDSAYVPVELTSFYSEILNNKVILNWLTASETNNLGFEIEKSKSGSQVWQRLGFVQGNGTTTKEHAYSYIDFINETGNYFYRLKQVDYDGSFEYSNIILVYINSPSRFSLSQNFPNPFNNSTNISYQIPNDELVSLKVYDVLGNEVKNIMTKNQKAGYYIIKFSASDLSSGIYFYTLTAGEHSSTKKLILLK